MSFMLTQILTAYDSRQDNNTDEAFVSTNYKKFVTKNGHPLGEKRMKK